MTDRFAIVVDGTSCQSPEVQREFDLRLLPLHVDIGKETFTANVDLTPAQFYEKIAAPGVLTGTSQPSMGECRDVYDSVVKDGIAHPIDRVRTREKAVTRLKEMISERVPQGARIHACTLHTNDPERATALAEWLQERYHCVEHWTTEAGAVIGARAGPGVLGVSWYREDGAQL